MWASSIWGLIGLAASIVLTILGSRITGHENLLWAVAAAILILSIIVGLWPLLIRLGNPWPIAGMLAGTVLVLTSAAAWFFGPHFKTLPGFSAFAFARLYDTPELRRKYIFDFSSPDGAAASFHLGPDDRFRFQIKDVHKESYTLEIPIGNRGVPIDRYIFLYCQVALGFQETVLRVLVDGKEVRKREYDFPIDLGSRDWKKGTLFADTEGKNSEPFKIAMFGLSHVTMSDFQIGRMQSRFTAYLQDVNSPIVRPN
jgi:hypothetical protein